MARVRRRSRSGIPGAGSDRLVPGDPGVPDGWRLSAGSAGLERWWWRYPEYQAGELPVPHADLSTDSTQPATLHPDPAAGVSRLSSAERLLSPLGNFRPLQLP